MSSLHTEDQSLDEHGTRLRMRDAAWWDDSDYVLHAEKQESDIPFDSISISGMDYAAFEIADRILPETKAAFDPSTQEDEDVYVPLIRPVLYRLPNVNPICAILA